MIEAALPFKTHVPVLGSSRRGHDARFSGRLLMTTVLGLRRMKRALCGSPGKSRLLGGGGNLRSSGAGGLTRVR